jgi:hypothetical protein
MTKEKLQEMADDLGIAFILRPNGSVIHHPSEQGDPPGELVIRPRKPWVVSPHGAPEGDPDAPTSG